MGGARANEPVTRARGQRTPFRSVCLSLFRFWVGNGCLLCCGACPPGPLKAGCAGIPARARRSLSASEGAASLLAYGSATVAQRASGRPKAPRSQEIPHDRPAHPVCHLERCNGPHRPAPAVRCCRPVRRSGGGGPPPSARTAGGALRRGGGRQGGGSHGGCAGRRLARCGCIGCGRYPLWPCRCSGS